eukprot:924096-Alexandrium_andersonii.AAC.1
MLMGGCSDSRRLAMATPAFARGRDLGPAPRNPDGDNEKHPRRPKSADRQTVRTPTRGGAR